MGDGVCLGWAITTYRECGAVLLLGQIRDAGKDNPTYCALYGAVVRYGLEYGMGYLAGWAPSTNGTVVVGVAVGRGSAALALSLLLLVRRLAVKVERMKSSSSRRLA